MTVILQSSCRGTDGEAPVKEDEVNGGAANKPARAEFLVSFLVDARGGAMTGCRSASQLKIVIPPRAAEQPVRITCRQVRGDNVLHPPPLNDGEGLAARILQLTPGCSFLTPILLELKYSTQDTKEREIVIYRCDTANKWNLHTNCDPDHNLTSFLSTSAYDISKLNDTTNEFKIQIITTSLPKYFALVSRPKHQILDLDLPGGSVSSIMYPGLHCTFPAKALTKPVSIGLSVCESRPCLLSELETQGGAISPVFTIEPRRRKFHKPVTISLPIPHPKQISKNDDGDPIEMSLMLLCSMCESGSRSVWENVTESTPLTRTTTGCIQFNTVVSAAFWVVNLPTWMVTDSLPMLDKLFRSMCRVPYRAKLAIFWREEEAKHREECNFGEEGFEEEDEVAEATVRVLVWTQEDRGQEVNCLETQEGYKPLVNCTDLVIHDGDSLEVFIKGNLVKLHEAGARIRFKPFLENRATVSVRRAQTNISAAGNLDILSEESSIFSSSIVLPLKK